MAKEIADDGSKMIDYAKLIAKFTVDEKWVWKILNNFEYLQYFIYTCTLLIYENWSSGLPTRADQANLIDIFFGTLQHYVKECER